MNIFISDADPIIAARNLDDKRVIKMILESTQILSTALHLNNSSGPYKPTHTKHPSTIWAAHSSENWKWLMEHSLALCTEYTKAYGRVHKCQNILNDMLNKQLINFLPKKDLTVFPNCTKNKKNNIDFSSVEDTVLAYKKYLTARWDTDVIPPTWKVRGAPAWLLGSESRFKSGEKVKKD